MNHKEIWQWSKDGKHWYGKYKAYAELYRKVKRDTGLNPSKYFVKVEIEPVECHT
jgi:hypothetical protein